jgi:gliding motility-associated peptidyl-prolyl isomerase
MKKVLILIILCFSIISCKQQQARMPISHSSGVFLKQSAERNKKLIKDEEKRIDSIIKSDPKINYLASQKGYWYHYISQNEIDTNFPTKGDIVTFTYEIKNLSNKIIYSAEELGNQNYIVDKQDILTGLRDGIKLMHNKETVQFLFPSHMAYGYHGDDKKIGTNEPIICKVTILSIKKGVENTDKPAAKVVQPTTTEAPKMRENKIETQSTTTPQ